MSKIYEALLQAELDRAATNGDKPAQKQEQPAASILRSLERSVEFVPFAAPVVSEAAEPVPMEQASSPVQASAHTLDGSRVVRRPWSPSLLQLPALGERGAAVEQFHSLRSRMYELRDLNTLKSVAISSGLPEEGKSFIAANLAISLARHKASKVLLIDGDMRRGSLHKLLGCASEPGLTEYLSGKHSLLEVMQRASRSDGADLPKGLDSLTFVPCGADAENAADLSGNRRFAELIRDLSPMFDWILVDTPPVNLVADGVNLARSCDGTLLVARGGVTKYESAQRAVQELKAAKVFGFVLNAVEKPPTTGGYYGYDSYKKIQE